MNNSFLIYVFNRFILKNLFIGSSSIVKRVVVKVVD